jgi:hypothetical protein
MKYFVKKGDQQSGPFTLGELNDQVKAGNVLSSDLTQSEGMSDWVAVEQVLGTVPVPAAATYCADGAPSFEVGSEPAPLPFNLHWSLVLILGIFTNQIFNFFWAFYLAIWARKLDGNNKHIVLVAMYPAGFVAGVVASMNHIEALPGILIFAGAIAYIVGVFSIKSAMEDYYNGRENIGLSLSGGMTFFFSTVYLQYHINQIAKMKKSGVFATALS